jgi:acyl-CoA synthetase (NDP forming)/GNAT superfamily N-acetyltransferase
MHAVLPDSDALLADAEIVRIRQAGPGDLAALRALHERLSARTLYLRYFSGAPGVERYLKRLLRPADNDHEALIAVLRGEVCAVGCYERITQRPQEAEVAFLVDDAHQGIGVGTLLLEHLAAAAAAAGIERFMAETLPGNAAMLSVFRDAGFAVTTRYEDGTVHVEFPIEPDEQTLAAAEAREGRSQYRSLERLLRPESVSVVGAGTHQGGLGHQILENLVAGGFRGPVYPVNRGAGEVCGLPAWPSLLEVPDPVDLVVVAVPAEDVLEVARQSATRGARSLVVITAQFAEAGEAGAARERELREICRAAAMRLVGPNCMGVAGHTGGQAMNATFTPHLPPPGGVGLMSQSGAIGIAALEYAARTGTGISSFVSAGNKADVSGNDLLSFWERDPDTHVCALYLESFGNPRKFARIARRVGRIKPVVAVKSGRSVAGTRGVRSHTAAAATPEVAVDALFAQAGVIRAETLGELFDVVTLLDRAPLPAGNRVAIVGNSGGPGVLAADACEPAGLTVPELSEETRRTLAALLPAGAAVSNPVDLLAGADPATLEAAVRAVLADPRIDAVIAIHTPVVPSTAEPMAAAIAAAAEGASKPVVAVILAVPEMPAALRGQDGRPLVPYHPFPETAARALGAVAHYAAWRAQPDGTPATLEGIDQDSAVALVIAALAAEPGGTWLRADTAARLVGYYGIRTVPTVPVATAGQAVAAAEKLGWPVVLKAAAGNLVHKTDLHAVAMGLAGPAELRAAFSDMSGRLGSRMGGAVMQPMARPGVETAAGVAVDRSFGPLVMFGLGGVASDLLADRGFRILPMTREDAAEQVRGLRASPLLFGYRGSEPVDVAGLEDLLLRLARLAADLPEVAELDLNPVVARPDGVEALDVKVRLSPAVTDFPLLRRLRP